jgi:hypothetical protein
MKAFLPESPQANISYDVYDICEPPSGNLAGSFDLTHLRFVLGGSAKVGVDAAVSHLANTLRPGGWLQVQELDLSPDLPGQGQAVADTCRIISGMFEKLGLGGKYALTLGDAFKKAGLVNVTVQQVELPAGKKLGNEQDMENSIEPFKITIPSITMAAKGIY